MTGERKGLHPLAWVGIGCAVIVIFLAIVITVVCGFAAKKVGDFAQQAEKDPGAVVEFFVKMNPDVEVVSRDAEKGEITIRNKKSGEVVTVNYQDLKDGKVSFDSGEGTVSIDARDGESGGMTIEGADGNLKIGGAASPDDLPGWIPVYPDAGEITGSYTQQTADGKAGTFTYQCADDVETVKLWYASEVEALGMQVEQSTMAGGGQSMAIVSGSDATRELTANVVSMDTGTQVTVQYSEKP